MNFKTIPSSVLFTSWFFLWISTALCEADHRHHEVHQHGAAELGIVQEAGEVSIVLRAPASDLAGFEHTAKTVDEKMAVSKLETLLGRSDQLFVFLSEAECRQIDHSIEHSLVGEDRKENSHGHKHEHIEKGHSNSHSEISVTYRFACQEFENLTSLQVGLFREFPTLRKIEASIVMSSFQGKQTLTPSSSKIILVK